MIYLVEHSTFAPLLDQGRRSSFPLLRWKIPSFGLDMLNAQVDAFKGEEPDTAVNQELGVGVKAYWSTSEHAGQYTVLTEEHVFAVSLGGNIGAPEDHKAALLTLAQIIEKQQ